MADVKLDFSKMKHVHSDDHFTTLRHSTDGHVIKLAHKSLSPENQNALKALSGIAKQAQQSDDADEMKHKMADGGPAINYDKMMALQKPFNPNAQATPTPQISPQAESLPQYNDSNRLEQAATRSKARTDQESKDWAAQNQPQQASQPMPTPGGNVVQTKSIAPQAPIQVDDNGNPMAEGGSVEKERALDYKGMKNEIKSLPRGPSTTLNYKDLKKEYTEKNRKPLAVGGPATESHPGEETCMHCGGPIQNFDEGGQAQPPANLDPNSTNPVQGVTTDIPAMANNVKPDSNLTPDQQRTREIYNQSVSKPANRAKFGTPTDPGQFPADGGAPANFNSGTWQQAAQAETQEKAQNAAQATQQQQATIADNQARVQAGLDPLPIPNVPNGPQVPGSPMNPPTPNVINPTGAPIQDGPSQDMGMGNMAAMSGQGYMNSMLGTMGMGAAQSNLAQQQAKIQNTYAQADANVLNNYKQSSDDINGEMDAVRNDIAESHITPENYWTGDKDGNGSHSKIASAIGMIVAGFNPTNKPNAAIDFLKNQMDMNLNAQVYEMGKKQNVLTSLQNKFKNMRDTMDFTRLVNAQMAQSQLAKAASQAAGGPNGMAAMAAQQAIGKLQMDYAPIQQRLNMSQAMMKMANSPSGDPDMDVAQATKMARYATALGDTQTAKQWQDATVPGVGVTKNLASVPDAVKSQIVSHKTVNDTMNMALELAKQPIPTNPAEYAKYQARTATIQGQLIGAVKQAQHDGVYKPTEAEFLTSQIGSGPGSIFRSLSAIPKIEELQNAKQAEYNNLLQTNNLPVRQLPRTNMQQEQTKTVNGVTYKRGPNGEAVKVSQ